MALVEEEESGVRKARNRETGYYKTKYGGENGCMRG